MKMKHHEKAELHLKKAAEHHTAAKMHMHEAKKEKHADVKEDKKLVKKMVKKDCMNPDHPNGVQKLQCSCSMQ